MATGKTTTLDADLLTAVVVADSFDAHFQPLTSQGPRCLLPLVTQPLLAHTLELLSVTAAQIAEILVVCCSHSEAIRQYIELRIFLFLVLLSVSVCVCVCARVGAIHTHTRSSDCGF